MMAVVALEIKTRQALAGGQEFGSVGRYLQLDGTVHFAVDPAHPLNRCITDIDLARARVTVLCISPQISASLLRKTLYGAIIACCSTCRTVATASRWQRSIASLDRSTPARRRMPAMAS
jgi:exosome complex RNA-binding protein Csl4